MEFYVCGERLLLEEGGCYYVNVNLPHRVNNRGNAARVHLVIDAIVNDWLRAVSTNAARFPGRRCSGRLGEFADLVFADENLRGKLRGVPDHADLVRVAVREASDGDST